MSQNASTNENQEIVEEGFGDSLPNLLNILYRGRRVIFYLTLVGLLAGIGYGIFTKPLYRATAQVRPGIVSYSGQGAPIREGALKDVVRWFRKALFWDDMYEVKPYDSMKVPPIIMADFISSGPQYMRGGDVITLTNLATDPLLAVDTLKRSIASFNRQASQDSSRSSLQLTMGGVEVRMDKIRNNISRIDGEVQRAELEIKKLEAEILVVDASNKKLAKKFDRLESGRTWRLNAAANSKAEAEAGQLRLVEAEKMLQNLMASEPITTNGRANDSDAVSEILLQTVKRNEAALAGELLSTVNQLSAYIYQSTTRADSLNDSIKEIDMEMANIELTMLVDMVQKKENLKLRIIDLEIKKSVDLVQDKAELEDDLHGHQVQLDMLTPLEQVGRVTVSQHPVRPRKLRAGSILTFLAFMGSLFVVFAWEYYQRNKEAISFEENS